MRPIKQLPQSVINKIAAGEVIERPASVVKELVENSVDAGARRISVVVQQGGTELIRVTDDGCGIAAEQLPLAVASHATSKIAQADDLFEVITLGFRGEALASIAEVSQFCIRSRPRDADAGAELEVMGGESGQVVPCACATGTTIEARHLFFNTPVRRRFMRTTQTEMSHITEALARIGLAHPQIHFTLQHNDRQSLEMPAAADWGERIGLLFGDELARSLIPVDADEGPIRIHGYVADPSQNRANGRMQYLFLNGRYIRDRSLSHALGEAYRGLLMTGRHAIAFLQLEMPPDLVDVNVHPTKLEVRFVDGGRIYSQLLGMLRSKFLTTDLTTRASLSADAGAGQGARGSSYAPPFSPSTADPDPRVQRSISLDFRQPPQPQSSTRTAPTAAAGVRSGEWSLGGLPSAPATTVARQPAGLVPAAVMTHADDGAPAMQVYDQYLITESDEGVIVIDQHALHERILYEELKEKVTGGNPLEVQRLLVPEPVPMSAREAAAVMDHVDTLKQLGITVEALSETTLVVMSYPAMLSNFSPPEVLRQLSAKLQVPNTSLNPRDLLDELLHMIACKAAIKAGDRLTCEEIATLLRRRNLVEDAHHCPHGRPTTLIFSREELDRRFKRV